MIEFRVVGPSTRNIDNYDPQHFSLPVFGIYGNVSAKKLIKKYRKERKQIRKLYKGNDEVDVALKWLTL